MVKRSRRPSNTSNPHAAVSMSDIPVISITQECSDDDVDIDDVSKLNINEALTDTEDLFMDQDTVRYRKGSTSPKIAGYSMIDAIAPTTNGSVTDVEDCTDSEDENESERPKSAREADIALDSFLDQGYVDETTKSSNKGDKPKTLTRCFSKATESDSLQVFADSSNALTDCEDCALSDDDDSLGKVSIPDCPEDILMRDADNDAVDVHNSMKRKQEKHTHHKQDAVEESSSDSENECKVRHRRGHRKVEERPRSDCENFSMSDDDMAGACAKPPSNRQSALFEAEELVMEGSDAEEDRTQVFPEINITFVSEGPDTPTESTGAKSKRPASLSVAAPNADEALTDVENLDSSDSEDERVTTGKRLIPRAVVRSGRGDGGTTDVEDFNDSDDNDQEEPDQKREVGQEFLPSPVRELAILSQGEAGAQKQNVMPLNQGLLMVGTPDMEQALTDVEDMSGGEEAGELYDSSKYMIESLPDLENGDVYSSDNTCVKTAKLEVMSPTQEPKTDTEDLFFERSASNSGSGSELRRRRKPKHSTMSGSSCQQQQQQQFKGRKFLEMKADTAATATTDVEDMYLSDDAKDCGFAPSKQRRATIQFSGLTAPTNDCDAKTDVEFLSGDELVNDHRGMHSPQLCFDGYSSVIKARERNGLTKDEGLLDGYAIPMIRKVSPSPDAHICHTDSEDIQGVSDEDEQAMNGSYSRAQTATPYELTRALDESSGCEIHDESSARVKGVLLDVKGMTGGDQQEMHTDVEFLDDDAGNGADQ